MLALGQTSAPRRPDHGSNVPVILVRLDDHDLAEDLAVRVELREEDEEVVCVWRGCERLITVQREVRWGFGARADPSVKATYTSRSSR